MSLAKHGMNISIADVDLIKAEATANEIMKLYNVKSKAYKLDVSKNEEIIKIREMITQEMGSVDILVNNAGLMTFNTFEQQKAEQIEKLIQVNVLGIILVRRRNGIKQNREKSKELNIFNVDVQVFFGTNGAEW